MGKRGNFSILMSLGLGLLALPIALAAADSIQVSNQVRAFRGQENQNSDACVQAGDVVQGILNQELKIRAQQKAELDYLSSLLDYTAIIKAQAINDSTVLVQADNKYHYRTNQDLLDAVPGVLADHKKNLLKLENQFSSLNTNFGLPVAPADISPMDIMVQVLQNQRLANAQGNKLAASSFNFVQGLSVECNASITGLQISAASLKSQLTAMLPLFKKIEADDIAAKANTDQAFVVDQVARLELNQGGNQIEYVASNIALNVDPSDGSASAITVVFQQEAAPAVPPIGQVVQTAGKSQSFPVIPADQSLFSRISSALAKADLNTSAKILKPSSYGLADPIKSSVVLQHWGVAAR